MTGAEVIGLLILWLCCLVFAYGLGLLIGEIIEWWRER